MLNLASEVTAGPVKWRQICPLRVGVDPAKNQDNSIVGDSGRVPNYRDELEAPKVKTSGPIWVAG